MASDQVQYNHRKTKSDEPSEAAVDTADRGLFGFGGKKEEKCEGEVITDEFDKKVKVSEEKEDTKKHGTLLEKLNRSNSSSSSSSEEEVEENGEKKKKKKDKIGKGEDANIATEKCDDTPAEEKKGFLDKIKEKLPGGGKKAEEVASPPPTPAAAEPATSPGGAEKKGLLDKIKDKIPGYSKSDEEKEIEKENECK